MGGTTPARRYIVANYTNRHLSSDSVAEHLGISRRSLQRLFEDEEHSVSQYINDIRTKHALTRLKDRRFADVPLSEIAELSGFPNSVAMRRAIRDATGLAPVDLRKGKSA